MPFFFRTGRDRTGGEILGSEGSAAGGRKSEPSEWQRSKKTRSKSEDFFGHRNRTRGTKKHGNPNGACRVFFVPVGFLYQVSSPEGPRLPLTRELSAKLTEGETLERLSHFSPSVKTFGFATSLIRGRLWRDIRSTHIGNCFTSICLWRRFLFPLFSSETL